MKSGDLVICGNERGRIVNITNLLAIFQAGSPNHWYGIEKTVIFAHLKRFIPLPVNDQGICPALQEAVKKLPEIQEQLNQALKALLPDEQPAKMIDNEIFLYHKSVSLTPVISEVAAINGIHEIVAYAVTAWKHHPGSWEEPPDVSDTEIGTYQSQSQAIQKAIETVFKLKQDDYWEQLAYQELANLYQKTCQFNP